MNTGDLIKKRRLELGLSLNDVAKALKVNKSTVLRYETKEIEKLPIDVIEPLAKVLHTTPAWLLGWEEDPIILERDNDLDNISDFLFENG